MDSLTKYNTENSDLITQLIFDDRITMSALRIAKFLDIPVIDEKTGRRYKRKVYSCRGIAKMMGISLSSTVRALQTLKDIGVVKDEDGQYSLTLKEDDSKMDQPKKTIQKRIATDPKMDLIRSENGSESDSKMDHNISKQIYLKNVSKINKDILDLTIFKPQHEKIILDSFLPHRNEIKKPVTQRALQLIANEIQDWTAQELLESVQNSIKNRWTGLFKPRIQAQKETASQYNIRVMNELNAEISGSRR